MTLFKEQAVAHAGERAGHCSEVKAVVKVMPGRPADAATANALMALCIGHLARHKSPRSVDFIARMPRLPIGKLYTKPLRQKHWADHKSRIL